jgi:hypothetical protein
LLLCNVTVKEAEDGALILVVNPEAMLTMPRLADNADIVSEVRTRLERIVLSLKFGQKL